MIFRRHRFKNTNSEALVLSPNMKRRSTNQAMRNTVDYIGSFSATSNDASLEYVFHIGPIGKKANGREHS